MWACSTPVELMCAENGVEHPNKEGYRPLGKMVVPYSVYSLGLVPF